MSHGKWKQRVHVSFSTTCMILLLILSSLSFPFPKGATVSFFSSAPSHSPILVIGDSAFTPANGILSGSGTTKDPFIIGNWMINSQGAGISIFNTTSSFIIQSVQVLSANSGYRGIYFHNITNGEIRESTITNSTVGIFLDHSTNVSILNDTIADLTGVRTPDATGIFTDHCSRMTISGNHLFSALTRQKHGIYLNASPTVTISSNTIWYSAFAITLNNTAHAFVTGNNASYNAATGLYLSDSPYANVIGNYFTYDAEGIEVTYTGNLSSPNCTLTDNVVDFNAENGIVVRSDNTTISRNEISSNQGPGIDFPGYPTANNTIIARNSFAFNYGGGISCCGFPEYPPRQNILLTANTFTNDGVLLSSIRGRGINLTITSDNLVNGKPLLFYQNCASLTIDDVAVGQLILSNCTGPVRISNVRITNTIEGIEMIDVNSASVTGSIVNSNVKMGIFLSDCFDITITGNNLSNNGRLVSYSNYFDDVQNYTSPPAALVRFPLLSSTGLTAYGNNFIEDTAIGSKVDAWNSIYPTGGNYWSDYRGIDNCSGPMQNICPNPDGIGDTPYNVTFPSLLGTPGMDHYPLMKPHLAAPDTEPPAWISSLKLVVANIGVGSVSLYWMKATDDLGVVSYKVYEGNSLLATISANSTARSIPLLPIDGYEYAVGNLDPATTYTFTIVAIDAAGNPSVAGLSATATTLPSNVSSLLLRYWYLIAIGGGGAVATLMVFLQLRKSRTSTRRNTGTATDRIKKDDDAYSSMK